MSVCLGCTNSKCFWSANLLKDSRDLGVSHWEVLKCKAQWVARMLLVHELAPAWGTSLWHYSSHCHLVPNDQMWHWGWAALPCLGALRAGLCCLLEEELQQVSSLPDRNHLLMKPCMLLGVFVTCLSSSSPRIWFCSVTFWCASSACMCVNGAVARPDFSLSYTPAEDCKAAGNKVNCQPRLTCVCEMCVQPNYTVTSKCRVSLTVGTWDTSCPPEYTLISHTIVLCIPKKYLNHCRIQEITSWKANHDSLHIWDLAVCKPLLSRHQVWHQCVGSYL